MQFQIFDFTRPSSREALFECLWYAARPRRRPFGKKNEACALSIASVQKGTAAERIRLTRERLGRKAAEAKSCKKKVPRACWGMFKAFLEEKPGEFDKKEPTLADLIQRILEVAGCEIDTTNWVAYHVSLHLVVV